MIALIRFWKEGIIAVLMIALALMWLGKTAVEQRVARLSAQLSEANLIIASERQAMRDRTAVARAQDAANKARVERGQDSITQETVSEYQKDIAALRHRATGRVWAASASSDSSRRGSPPVSSLPSPSGRSDGTSGEARLPDSDALIASEQAVRLRALQEWVTEQAAVEREEGRFSR